MRAPHTPTVAPPLGLQSGVAVAGGALVIGSVLAVDPAGWSPFGPARWLAISTLALVTVAVAVGTGHRRPHRPTAVAWGVLLGLIGVAALTGPDPWIAVAGHPDRHLGLVTWALFGMLFLSGQQVSTDQGILTVVRAAAVASLLVGLWSTWELLIGRPIDVGAKTDRLLGPYGSAAYLGAAACLFVPMSIGLAADREERRPWRTLGTMGAATGTIALVGSGARSAWLGAAITAVIVLTTLRPVRRAAVAWGAVAMASAAGVVALAGPILERDAGWSSRLDEWRVAAQVMIEHPLTGIGPEGYRIAFAEGVDEDYERTYGRERVLPDRAHAASLDVGLVGGVPAAVTYLGLVGVVGWRALAAVRRRGVIAGLGAGVIAYAVQQQLLFPLAELDPLWWLAAGVVVAATSTGADPASIDPAGIVVPRRVERITAALRAPAAIGLAVLAVVAAVLGTLDVAADRLAKRSLDAVATGRTEWAVDLAEQAVGRRPDHIGIRLVAAEVHERRGTLAGLDAALAHVRDGLSISPLDPVLADREASLLSARAAATGDDVDVRAALVAWGDLVDRDPLRTRWQFEYGRAAALAGDTALARSAWATVLRLDPDHPLAADLLDALGPS